MFSYKVRSFFTYETETIDSPVKITPDADVDQSNMEYNYWFKEKLGFLDFLQKSFTEWNY